MFEDPEFGVRAQFPSSESGAWSPKLEARSEHVGNALESLGESFLSHHT